MNHYPWRSVTSWFCILFLLLQTGCAHVPFSLSDAARSRLGTAAVASARFVPKMELLTPAKGGLSGAGRKAAKWSLACLTFPVQGNGGSCSGEFCGAAYLLLAALTVAAATVGGLTGGVVGATQAEPAEVIEQQEKVIQTSIAGLQIQENMRERFVKLALQTGRDLVELKENGPSFDGEAVNYGPLASRQIDSVIQLSVVEMGLDGEWDVNPPIYFHMKADVTIFRTADGSSLYHDFFEYTSPKYTFAEWSANNAQSLCNQIDLAYDMLAQQMVLRLFDASPPTK